MGSGYAALLGTALAWSFSGIFTKLNSQEGFLISAVSSAVALAFYLLIIRPTIRFPRLVLAAGVSACFMSLTFTYANKLTTVGSAIVLQYSSMAFVALYEAIEQRRVPPARKLFIIVMALTGMVVFFFDSLSPESMLGNVLAIVSGAFFGLMFFLDSKHGSSPVTSSMISCCLMMIPGIAFIPRLGAVLPSEWALMVSAGVVSTGIANVCFAHGILRVPPLTANLITMLEVVFAPVWSHLIFGESFGRFALVGTVLIIGSLVVNLVWEQREREAARAGEASASTRACDGTRSREGRSLCARPHVHL